MTVPALSEAGSVDAPGATASSTWVVGDACIYTLVACQDDGAFRVFERGGPRGTFAYVTDGLCGLPEALAARWYPGGRYPLGVRCSASEALTWRSGVRGGGIWNALLPRGWVHVTCASAPSSESALCSSEGGDTDSDIWFDPHDRGALLDVTTCRGGGCDPLAAGGGPSLVAPRGMRLGQRLSAREVALSGPAGVPPAGLSRGVNPIVGVLLAGGRGAGARFPLVTVELELPATEGGIGPAILASVALGPAASAAG